MLQSTARCSKGQQDDCSIALQCTANPTNAKCPYIVGGTKLPSFHLLSRRLPYSAAWPKSWLPSPEPRCTSQGEELEGMTPRWASLPDNIFLTSQSSYKECRKTTKPSSHFGRLIQNRIVVNGMKSWAVPGNVHGTLSDVSNALSRATRPVCHPWCNCNPAASYHESRTTETDALFGPSIIAQLFGSTLV